MRFYRSLENLFKKADKEEKIFASRKVNLCVYKSYFRCTSLLLPIHRHDARCDNETTTHNVQKYTIIARHVEEGEKKNKKEKEVRGCSFREKSRQRN